MPDLSTLPEDIYRLFDESVNHEPSEENLDRLCSDFRDLIRRRLAAAPTSRDVLRFSALGRPDRQLWYASREAPENLSGKTQLKFLYGDLIECVALFLAKEAGHTVEREQEELEVDGVKGHIDAVIDGVTVDVKSASPQGYAKFANGRLFDDDPFGYISQISSYASIATPGRGGAFLAMDKVHGDLCVLNVGASVTDSMDVSARVDHLREVIKSDVAPERCYPDEADGASGNRKLCTQCSYCAWNKKCWPGLRTFLYSGRPRHLTRVEREPNVPELI